MMVFRNTTNNLFICTIIKIFTTEAECDFPSLNIGKGIERKTNVSENEQEYNDHDRGIFTFLMKEISELPEVSNLRYKSLRKRFWKFLELSKIE
jgi:hypothetical protein